MRTYFGLRYVTERVQWTNEIESKLNVYNAEKDSVHRYRIADDLLRLRSNYGLKAWNKMYYTSTLSSARSSSTPIWRISAVCSPTSSLRTRSTWGSG